MKNEIIISSKVSENIISKYIYGGCLEHLGECIYDGICVSPKSDVSNIRGIRKKIIEALKKIKISVVRWPGGCFAENYHWKDGIGPYKNRIRTVNSEWGDMIENNNFGTHEFLDFCNLVGSDAFISANISSGTISELVQWIEYITYCEDSALAQLRKKNNREKPWKIKFLGLGNENWANGGNMDIQSYVSLYKRYHSFVRNYNGKIFKVACGLDGLSLNKKERTNGDFKWLNGLLKEAKDFIDLISIHYYVILGSWNSLEDSLKCDEKKWFNIFKDTFNFENIIKRTLSYLDKYDPQKKIGIAIDEWGTLYYDKKGPQNLHLTRSTNTLMEGIVAAVLFNIFNNNCERIRLANIVTLVNAAQALIITKGNNILFTPNYYIFKMYKGHQDGISLPIKIKCEKYRYNNSVIPLISASSSINKKGKITLSICNIHHSRDYEIDCYLPKKITNVKGTILTGKSINSYNDFNSPDEVKPMNFNNFNIDNQKLKISMVSKSVLVLEIS